MNFAKKQKIQGYKFDKDFSYEKLFDSFVSQGLQSTNLHKSIEILNEVITLKRKMGEDFKIIFGFTSNIISSGLRDIIRFMCQHKMVDAICTTSGGLEEDFMKCFKDTFIGKFKNNDKQLRKDGINRIGNMLVPNENYCTFQNFFTEIYKEMYKKQKEENFSWTPSKVIDFLGSKINDKRSVYFWCHQNKIPVFCTAITDGAIGDNVFFLSYQYEDFHIDISEDTWLLNDIARQSQKSACLILGGGMIKYQIMSMGLFNNGFDYAVFVNDGMEFDGSNSGQGPLKEVKEGKIKENAKFVKLNCEISLVFPLIVAQTFAKNC